MSDLMNSIALRWWEWMWPAFWQSCLLIAFVFLADLLTRRWAWPQVRYTLWLLVLVKLILPPSLSSPASLAGALLKPRPAQSVTAPSAPANTRPAPDLGVAMMPNPDAGRGAFAAPATAPAIAPATAHAISRATPKPAPAILSKKAWLMIVWFWGVVSLGAWAGLRFHGLRREYLLENASAGGAMRANAQESGNSGCSAGFSETLRAAAAQLRLRRLPTVVFSARIQSPAVFGLWRPVLVMPVEYRSGAGGESDRSDRSSSSGASDRSDASDQSDQSDGACGSDQSDAHGQAALSDEALRHILLHELAHIKRGDLLVNSLFVALQILYWFNPLLWLVRRRFQHLRELCCDATVAGLLQEETPAYRETLLHAVERLVHSHTHDGLGLLGLIEHPGNILERLRRLEKKIWRHPRLRLLTIALTVATMAIVVLPMVKSQSSSRTIKKPDAAKPDTASATTKESSTGSDSELSKKIEESFAAKSKTIGSLHVKFHFRTEIGGGMNSSSGTALMLSKSVEHAFQGNRAMEHTEQKHANGDLMRVDSAYWDGKVYKKYSPMIIRGLISDKRPADFLLSESPTEIAMIELKGQNDALPISASLHAPGAIIKRDSADPNRKTILVETSSIAGRTRLWLDESKNYLLTRKEFSYDRVEDGKEVHFKHEIEVLESKEVIPGLWLPTKWRRAAFVRRPNAAQKDEQKLFAMNNEVELIKINPQLAPEFFQFDFPVGTVVTSEITSTVAKSLPPTQPSAKESATTETASGTATDASGAKAETAKDMKTTDGVQFLEVSVKVLDEQNEPVAGAALTPDGLRTKLHRGNAYGWANIRFGPPRTARTDARGIAMLAVPKYAIEKKETGEVSFYVMHPDYRVSKSFDYPIDGSGQPIRIEKGATLKVSGYSGAMHTPIKGVFCQISGFDHHLENFWLPLPDGSLVTHQLPPGPHCIRLAHVPEDGVTVMSDIVSFSAEKGRTTDFNLELKPGVRLEGALDSAVPRPIRNGRVIVIVQSENKDKTRDTPTWATQQPVRENGQFAFPSLPPGAADIIAVCDGHVSKNPPGDNTAGHKPQTCLLKKRGQTQKVEIAMTPAFAAEVLVADDQDRPLPGAAVFFNPQTAWGTGGGYFGYIPWTMEDKILGRVKHLSMSDMYMQSPYRVVTDSAGIAVVRNLPQSSQSYSVSHPQYEMPARFIGHEKSRLDFVDLTLGQPKRIVIKMQKKGTEVLTGAETDEEEKPNEALKRALNGRPSGGVPTTPPPGHPFVAPPAAVTSMSLSFRTLRISPPDRPFGQLINLSRPRSDFAGPAPYWWWENFAYMGETLGEANRLLLIPDNCRLGLIVKAQSAHDDLAPLASLGPNELELLGFDPASPKPGDECLPALCNLTGLKTLGLGETTISNKGLGSLKQLTSLERLSVLGPRLDSTGIANISSIKSLKGLRISTSATITVADFSHLAKLVSLQELYFGWRAHEGAGLAQLVNLPELEYLVIGAQDCSGEGLENLAKFPSLQRLEFSDLSGKGLAALPEMSNLRDLHIQHKGDFFTSAQLASISRLSGLESLWIAARFTDDGLTQLKPLQRLKTLGLHGLWQDRDHITDAALAHIKDLQALESLKIYTGRFTDEGLGYLAQLPHLKKLEIPNNGDRFTGFTDAGLERLAKARELEDLYIRGDFITDEGLKHLEGLSSLKSLRFFGRSKVTQEGVAHLQAQLPNLKRVDAGYQLGKKQEAGNANLPATPLTAQSSGKDTATTKAAARAAAVTTTMPVHLQFRMVAKNNEQDKAEQLPYRSPNPRRKSDTLWILKDVIISDKDIAWVDVVPELQPGKYFAIDIRLNDEATKRFPDFTEQNIGRRLAMIYEGKICSAPEIVAKIKTGGAMVTDNFSQAEAQAIASTLTAASGAKGANQKPNAVKSAFSKVVERTINYTGKDCLIDFDTDRVFSAEDIGGGMAPNQAYEAVSRNGIDAGGSLPDVMRGLIGFDLIIFPLENESWDRVTAQDLFGGEYFRYFSSAKPGNPVYLNANGKLPVTFAFKTRENGFGLLQITALSDKPERGGVKIRYKMTYPASTSGEIGASLMDDAIRGIQWHLRHIREKKIQFEYTRSIKQDAGKTPIKQECTLLAYQGSYREEVRSPNGKKEYHYCSSVPSPGAPQLMDDLGDRHDFIRSDVRTDSKSISYHQYPHMNNIDGALAPQWSQPSGGFSRLRKLAAIQPGVQKNGYQCVEFGDSGYYAPELNWACVDNRSVSYKNFAKYGDIYLPREIKDGNTEYSISKVIMDADFDPGILKLPEPKAGWSILFEYPQWTAAADATIVDQEAISSCRPEGGPVDDSNAQGVLKRLLISIPYWRLDDFSFAIYHSFPLPSYDNKRNLVIWVKYNSDLGKYVKVCEGDQLPERYGPAPWQDLAKMAKGWFPKQR